jgi:predicted aspartyl protease
MVVVLAVVAATPAATAQVYQWTDGTDVVHYTTDRDGIPETFRATVRELDSARSVSPPTEVEPPDSQATAVAGPILAPASLNGIGVTLLIDTGADRTVIAPDALTRAGVDAAAGREVRIVGVGGSAEAREIVVDRLEVGGVRLGPITVIAHDVSGSGADGLLGRDLLGYFNLAVNGGRLTLAPR